MKIAIIGYGKMGKEIETMALQYQHEIVAKIDNESDWTTQLEALKTADLAIEFTVPDAVINNINKCFDLKLPIVVGTTGWYDKLPEITAKCNSLNQTLLWASNFSIGANVFFAINARLAEIMSSQPQYNVEVEEIHHTQKLDAPSGTAISIANEILKNVKTKHVWVNEKSEKTEELSIISKREGKVPGTHIVQYQSEIDVIEIKHEAKNRKGLALGAVKAAEWVKGKKGVFQIKDMLNF